MEKSMLGRAVEAGRAVAAGAGLDVEEARIITDSDRITLHLQPCDVLARVAPAAHRAESEFEVSVARRVTEAGGPVAPLDPRVPPRVVMRDSFAVSLWTYYEPVKAELTPAAYADALLSYHAALRRVSLTAPHVTERIGGALSELHDRKRTPNLTEPDRRLLLDTLSGVSEAISTAEAATAEQLLHGEPHPGNVLSTSRGPLFVDLATCCRGPIEFDLAHAPEAVAQHYPGADPALTRRCRAAKWALYSTWRWRDTDQFPDRAYWRKEGLRRVREAAGQ